MKSIPNLIGINYSLSPCFSSGVVDGPVSLSSFCWAVSKPSSSFDESGVYSTWESDTAVVDVSFSSGGGLIDASSFSSTSLPSLSVSLDEAS